MLQFDKKLNYGFTLVEMIVSLALFAVVVTIAVGALLTIVASNEQRQEEAGIMSNLSFALDSMTREIRTGEDYYCRSRPNTSAGGPNNMFNNSHDLDIVLPPGTTRDCSTGPSTGHALVGLSFVEGGDSLSGAAGDRVLFFFDGNTNTIYRRIGASSAEPIISSGIHIDDMRFYVTGSAPLSDNNNEDDQPAVTIFIEARATSTASKSFQIQTTVTQRALDL